MDQTMGRMIVAGTDAGAVTLPTGVKFPVELRIPDGFDPDRPETWPSVDGRLEFVGGRLLYMPPCGDVQQDVVADVVLLLGGWVRRHPEFVLATNEAGIRLGDASRGADAAIFQRAAVGPYTGKFRRVPPVLAVEVSGDDEAVNVLREKARWYLSVGVLHVWLVIPEERAVLAVTLAGERRFERGESLTEVAELPGLAPAVAEFFRQLDAEGGRRF
jgi:Uma2 family endonuclease